MGEQTDTITIRMKQSQLEKLRDTAQLKNIPLNTFLNQLFSNYLEVERIYEKFNWVKVSQSTLQLALKKITVKEIEQIGHHMAAEFAIDFILTKWGEISEKNIIHFIKIYFKENAWGTCKIFYEPEGMIITIQHKTGKKSSKLFSVMIKTLFKDQLNRESKTTYGVNNVTIKIPKNSNKNISNIIPKNINYTWYKSGFLN